MNAKHAQHTLYDDKPCHCGKKSQLELKWARVSDHIFVRQQVCSWSCAQDWVKQEAAREEAKS